jgi:hypothetical protein
MLLQQILLLPGAQYLGDGHAAVLEAISASIRAVSFHA